MASKGKLKPIHNDWKRNSKNSKFDSIERLLMIRTQKSSFFLSRFD